MRLSMRTFSLVASGVLALSSATAFAQLDPGACCAAQSSRVDALMNPVVGGDEAFFSASGSPTSVMFLVGTYVTMLDFVTPLPTAAEGCSNPADVAAFDVFYNITNPLKQGLTPVDADPTLGAVFFNASRYYTTTNTQLRSSSFDSSNSGNYSTVTSWATPAEVCGTGLGLAAPYLGTCTSCMTSRGWYRRDNNRYAMNGGVLNMNPPKFVTTRAVVKEVAASLNNVRIGFAAFHPGSGPENYDSPRIPVRMAPGCNALSPIDPVPVLAAVRSNINTLRFNGGERQIGEALTGIGAYFAQKAQWKTWFDNFTAPAGYLGPTNSNGSGNAPGYTWSKDYYWTDNFGNQTTVYDNGEAWCSECQQTMVIVLTDGTPQADNSVPAAQMLRLLVDAGTVKPDGAPLTFNPGLGGTCPNTSLAGGINFCDRFSSTKCFCDTVSGASSPDVTNRNLMDDVAFFLANMDLRPDRPGKQTIKTYTIGLSDNSPMLQSIAYAGGGLFYTASNSSQLKSAVIAAIQDVQSKTTGFSGASVAAVQNAGGSEAILPRLLPRADKPWIGSLWRFELYNEFVEGVSKTDGGLNNVLMMDDAGVEVVEDLVTGKFIKKGTVTNADAFWEAGDKLVTLGHANRSLWTVRDTNNDGAFTSADNLLEFSMANRAVLKQYLGVVSTPFCPVAGGANGTLLNRLGLTRTQLATAINSVYSGAVAATPTSQSELDDLCVAGLILYQRGADLADEDGDTNRTETRRSVMADIFHSTPVSVVPPVDTFLCDLGIINQCTRTLYSQTLSGVTPTTLASYNTGETDCGATEVARDAYEAWRYRGRRREKAVLVGTNDGVLHAFHNGSSTEACPGGVSTVTYNQGTGREVWGFIPPDQLSRLQDQLLGHTYGVDGDVMVRDIWADGTGADTTLDGIKQRDEYHTVAIAAEGRGGTHYFAVELDFNSTGNDQTTLRNRPKFLWMFPQPCSSEAAIFGKTLNSISPKPPPIGPVLIQNATSAYSRYTVNTDEVWVAMLSGGWSPGRERGRGVYMVDAYRGQINSRRDNLLWKFEFQDNASGDFTPLKKLGQSVAAPVAMVDYGENGDPRQDGFFDTALFGDVQGQLWVTRFQQPGILDNTTRLISNWRGGRTFEMDSDSPPDDPADGDLEPDDADKKSNLNKQPFYYLPAIAMDPANNELRAFIGTGERYSVLDSPAPVCRYDNPLACAKSQCNDVKIRYRLDSPGVDINRLETNFKKRQFAKGKADYTPQSDAFCGVDNLHARFEEYRVNACRLTDATDRNPGRVNDAQVRCTQNAAASSYSCNYTATPIIKTGELLPNALASVGGLGINRYYGLRVYGGPRIFLEGDNSAVTFDDGRRTDRPSGGDIVDVTSTTCTGPGACTGPSSNANGWFVQYDAQATKTATGSAIASSCVLWNTLSPAAGSANTCSAGAGNPTARLLQANVFTGAPDCAEGFLDGGVSQRSIARSVVAPPPEPATAIQLSKTGQVQTTALLIEPGQSSSINVTTGQDVLQLVYELPISRALHNCRHTDAGCSTAP
jgi:type IV pilus assembly protein PilY1